MEIVVCVKRVAATDSAIKVAADSKSIDPGGVQFELNPYDELAVEQALLTKEQLGAGTVTAVTLGSKDARKELQKSLAMGADKAVLLTTEGWSYDSYSTAVALAAYLKSIPCDLVFCGKQAVDADNSQFAPRLATLLDFACITEVNSLKLEDGTFTAERDIEGAREVISCSTPAVISCNKGLNEPRYPSLKGIMQAKKKPLEEVEATVPEAAVSIDSLSLPPARPEGRILGEGADAVAALVDALKNEAKVL